MANINLPKDPVMLLSFVNLKLRDCYDSIDTMCSELDIDRKELEDKLKSIDYEYDNDTNQFR